MKRIKKGVKILKDSGVLNGSKIILKKLSTLETPVNSSAETKDLVQFYEYITYEKKEANFKPENLKDITILWFIPDFGIGSGGHLNIFRMIFNLSKLGIKSDIAICGESQWVNNKIAQEMINKHFFPLESKIFIIKEKKEISSLNNYHIAMATSWQTAYYVNNFAKCYKKTYFVQDYEPYFYAHGSSYMFAENTYRFGFSGISAGSWLSNKLQNEYGMECESFSFSYDKELYFKQAKNEKRRRVFFYARPPTERRAFEMGLLSLKKVYELNPDIEIVLAGWDTSEYKIPFKHFNPGVVAIKELSNLYAQCDVALVLSFTNLSLLPLEILASGCPVVSNTGENNSWIDKDKKLFFYAENDIDSIVTKVDDILNKRETLDMKYIENFLNKTSWEEESNIVFDILNKIVDR